MSPPRPIDRFDRLLRWGLTPGSLGAIGFAAGCVAAAFGVRLIFWLFKPDLVIFATYYPAILLATLIGGWQAGIVAQVLGGIVAWIYFDPSLSPPTQPFGEQVADFGLYALSSGLIVWASEEYRRVVRRLDEEEHYRRLVVDELKHRLRNKLAVVQAVLGHELRAHGELYARIIDRLKALAQADELLARPDQETVDIRDILRVELSLYGPASVSVSGDHVQLPPKLAGTLLLVIHELATNAAKHGAFKLPNGHVTIGWHIENNRLRMEWIEAGGPPVSSPKKSGFGTNLFRRALDPFHGTIQTRFEPTGIRCAISLDIPAGAITGRDRHPIPIAPQELPSERL
jgi:two-component sensor histidine kinase